VKISLFRFVSFRNQSARSCDEVNISQRFWNVTGVKATSAAKVAFTYVFVSKSRMLIGDQPRICIVRKRPITQR